MSLDITLPEVKGHGTVARFYQHKGKDMAEVSFVGTKDSISLRVTPDLMAQYKREWDAYCDGKPLEPRAGTPLTDLSSISEDRAKEYVYRNVHNLEELAALSDAQCQGIGHGAMTERKAAIALVMHRQAQRRDALEKEVQNKSATIGPVPAEKYAGSSDVETLKAEVAELKEGIGQILEALAKPKKRAPTVKLKPGRVAKENAAMMAGLQAAIDADKKAAE